MKINHNFFSNLAFQIAEENLGKTKTNPSVGCVAVKGNTVISSGCTSINGRPHAEFNTLNKQKNFKGSSLYVTLEPCSHYGLTPPCTKIIKKRKIKKVYFNFYDPDKRTYKKAKQTLKKNHIKLNKINTALINRDFYKSYYVNKKKDLPFVDGKIAISNDYFTINKKSKWITNERSRLVSHLIRSKYDCIMSTSKTINKDNSLLNCRIKGLEKYQPDLVIVDRHLKLKKSLKLLKLNKIRKTYIITSSNNYKKINYFKKKRFIVVKMKSLDGKKDFRYFINKLFQIGKRRILVESGLIFLNKLLNFELINNLFIFKTNFSLKNYGFNNTKNNFLKRYKLNDFIKVNLDNDKLFKIKIK